MAQLIERAPGWVWVATAVIVPAVFGLFVADPFGWRRSYARPNPAPPTVTVTLTPDPSATERATATPAPDSSFVLADAVQDGVSVRRQGEAPQPLAAPAKTELLGGDALAVDEKGRAILRFSDFLTVEVLRQGALDVRLLTVSQQSALAVLAQSGGAFVNDLARAEDRLEHRVEVETEFARITATGTQWLLVKERNTPLEWLIALDATANDLTVAANSIEKYAPTGVAYWIAPIGGPSIPIRYLPVEPWLENVRAGSAQQEIGDVLWPQADVITDTRSIGTYTETVASSGHTPPQVVLDDVILEFHSDISNQPYELRDCNGDGILDVYMERGYIRFDFRGMQYRVRALDAQVVGFDRSDITLTAYNPNNEDIPLGWDELDNQLFSVYTDMRLQATEKFQEPFHYAILDLNPGCFLGFSLTPPNPDNSPGPPRWPVPLTTGTATPTATATPIPTISATSTQTPANSATSTPTPTASPTASSTPTGSVTPSPTPDNRVGSKTATDTPTPTPTPDGPVNPLGITETTTPTASVTATPTFTPTPCFNSQPTGWIAYPVVSGERLADIAQARGTTVAQIVQVNCLVSADVIYAGQELWVPPLLPPAPACAAQAEIKLSVRKVSDELVEIAWASNCFVAGTVYRDKEFAPVPLTLIVGQNGSKQISLGSSCRAGETFVIFELWYASGQKRTVTMQVEC